MRKMVIVFSGDSWDDEDEAEKFEEQVQNALDAANVDYLDLSVQ